MADLEVLEKLLAKKRTYVKKWSEKISRKAVIFKEVITALREGQKVRELQLSAPAQKIAKKYQLLTAKPVIYLANIAEDEIGNPANSLVKKVEDYSQQEQARVLVISAKIEADIAELPAADASLFLQDMGLEESSLQRIIKASYNLLNLITFFYYRR